MIINTFSIPLFVGNIDCSKIKFSKELKVEDTWASKTPSTYNTLGASSVLEKESAEYILKTFAGELDQVITGTYELSVVNIWENIYSKSDFQEPHMHPQSDLSFIIYKEVEESKTVFLNPARNIIQCFKLMCSDSVNLFSKEHFIPKLRSNQYVIFPSYLEHMVLKPKKPQVTIAGNLRIKKK